MAHRLLSFVLFLCLVCLCAVSSFAVDDLICADHNCYSSDPDAVCSMCLYYAAYSSDVSLFSASEPAETEVYGIKGYSSSWVSYALGSSSYTGTISRKQILSSLGYGFNYLFYFNPSVRLAAGANHWLHFKLKISDGSSSISLSDITGVKMGLNEDDGFISSTLYSGSYSITALDNGYLDVWVPWTCSSSTSSIVSTSQAFQLCLNTASTVSAWDCEIYGVQIYVDTDSITEHPVYSSGGGGGSSDPSYGEYQDLINWYNDTFGAAVSPEVSSSVSEIEQAQSQIEVVEDEIFSGITEYSDDVDPDLLSWPTELLSAVSWIGQTFMGLYDGAGDARFLISVSMTIGICMLIIGRGGHAIVVSSLRGSSSSRIRGGKKDA